MPELFDAGLIPKGWTWEFVGEDLIVISAGARKGHVTIDLLRRSFRAGAVKVRPRLSMTTYAGRGWRDKVVEDAVTWLKGVVAK